MASKHQQMCGRSFDPAFEMHLTYICSGRHFCILRADAKAMYGGQLNTLYFLVGLIVSFSESKCASERHVLQVLFQHVILLRLHFPAPPGTSHTLYIYIHPFSKTLQLEKYIYIYTSFVFTTRKQKNKYENKRYIYMYIYFSRSNVFENGCIYIYILKNYIKK